MMPPHTPNPSCSCASCKVYQSESENPSIRQYVTEGTRIDKLFLGKYIPMRERKLLNKLLKTRAAYDEVRNKLLSGSSTTINNKARENDSTERSSALLELVNLVDRGNVGNDTSECCSCCYCGSDGVVHHRHYEHQHHRRPPPQLARTHQRRQGYQKEPMPKHRVLHNVRRIKSVPCTCTFSLSGMVRQSKALIKRIRQEKSTPVMDAAYLSFDEVEHKQRMRDRAKTLALRSYDRIKQSEMRMRRGMETGARASVRKWRESTYKLRGSVKATKKRSVEGIKLVNQTVRQKAEDVQKSYHKLRKSIADLTDKIKEETAELAFQIRKDSIANFKDRLDKRKENDEWACQHECDSESCSPEECLQLLLRSNARETRQKNKLALGTYETTQSTSETSANIQSKGNASNAKRGPRKQATYKVKSTDLPKPKLNINIGNSKRIHTKSRTQESKLKSPNKKNSTQRNSICKCDEESSAHELHKKPKPQIKLQPEEHRSPEHANKWQLAASNNRRKKHKMTKIVSSVGQIKSTEINKNKASKSYSRTEIKHLDGDIITKEAAVSKADVKTKPTRSVSVTSTNQISVNVQAAPPQKQINKIKKRTKIKQKKHNQRKSISNTSLRHTTSSASKSVSKIRKGAIPKWSRKSISATKIKPIKPPTSVTSMNSNKSLSRGNRQAVKISSSFSFSIEFYKEIPNTGTKRTNTLNENNNLDHYFEKPLRNDKRDVFQYESNKNIRMAKKPRTGGFALKRCFCTLKLKSKKTAIKMTTSLSKSTATPNHLKGMGTLSAAGIHKHNYRKVQKRPYHSAKTNTNYTSKSTASIIKPVSNGTSKLLQTFDHRIERSSQMLSEVPDIDTTQSPNQKARIESSFSFGVQPKFIKRVNVEHKDFNRTTSSSKSTLTFKPVKNRVRQTVTQNRRKSKLGFSKYLLPYECEPGVCSPGECDPYECLKRINRRQGITIKRHNIRSSTEKSSVRSVSSLTDKRQPLKEKRFHTSIVTYKSEIPARKLKEEIYFRKLPSNSLPRDTNILTALQDEEIDQIRTKTKDHGSQSNTKLGEKSVNTQAAKKQKTTTLRKLIKICLCKLLKTEKSNNDSLKESSGRLEPKMSKGIRTKREFFSDLEPYECEPGVCIPGECDPYECLDRINRRELGTSIEKKQMVSDVSNTDNTLASFGVKTANIRKRNRSTTSDNKASIRNLPSTVIHPETLNRPISNDNKVRKRKIQNNFFQPVIPNQAVLSNNKVRHRTIPSNALQPAIIPTLPRQVVKIGSTFSFDIEFIKTRNANGRSAVEAENKKDAGFIQPKTYYKRYMGPEKVNIPVSNRESEHDVFQKTQKGMKPMLRRCFCTLKLMKKNKIQDFEKNINSLKPPKVYTVSHVTVTNTKITASNHKSHDYKIYNSASDLLLNIPSENWCSDPRTNNEQDERFDSYENLRTLRDNSKNDVISDYTDINSFALRHAKWKTINYSDYIPNLDTIRSQSIGAKPYLKRSFCTLNVKTLQKKKPKLDLYESQPEVCVPYECDPYECQTLIKQRSQGNTKGKLKQDQRNATYMTYNAVPIIPQRKYFPMAMPMSAQSSVRVGSSFNFDVKFTKDRSSNEQVMQPMVLIPNSGTMPEVDIDTKPEVGVVPRTPNDGMKKKYPKKKKKKRIRQPSVSPKPSKQTKHRKRKKQLNMSTQSSGAINRRSNTNAYAVSSGGNILKRCFCTLKLHKPERLTQIIEPLYEPRQTKRWRNQLAVDEQGIIPSTDIAYLRKLQSLDPDECEPGVCIPGECDPYQCLELIKRRRVKLKDAGTLSNSTKSVSSGTYNRKGRGKHVQYGRQRTQASQGYNYFKTAGTEPEGDFLPQSQFVQVGLDPEQVEFQQQYQQMYEQHPFQQQYDEQYDAPFQQQYQGPYQQQYQGPYQQQYEGPFQQQYQPQYGVQPQYNTNQNKQAVRIGSNYTLSVEFLKEKRHPHASPIETAAKAIQQERLAMKYAKKYPRYKTVTTQSGRIIKKLDSQVSVGTDSRGFEVSPLLKRCFCTLRLQQPNLQDIDTTLLTSSKRKGRKKRRANDTMSSQQSRSSMTRSKYLQPYECEPGVCVPGECDPYECLERIRNRLREFGTATERRERKSVGSMSSYVRNKGMQHENINRISVPSQYFTNSVEGKGVQARRERMYKVGKGVQSGIRGQRNLVGKGVYAQMGDAKSAYAQLDDGRYTRLPIGEAGHTVPFLPPERQSVKVGSNFNFNVEFFKERSGNNITNFVQPYSRTPYSGAPYGNGGNDFKITKVPKTYYDAPLYVNTKPETENAHKIKNVVKGTMASQGTNSTKNVKAQARIANNANYMPRVKVSEIRSKQRKKKHKRKVVPVGISAATITKTKYLAPYECEPGVCVPGECDPMECFERIKTRKELGTTTKLSTTKSVGSRKSFGGRQRKRKVKGIQYHRGDKHRSSATSQLTKQHFSQSSKSANKISGLTSSANFGTETTRQAGVYTAPTEYVASGKRQHAKGKTLHAARRGQHAAGYSQQSVGYRQQSRGYWQHTGGNGQQAEIYGQQTAGNGRQVGEYVQQAGGNRLQAVGYGQQAVGEPSYKSKKKVVRIGSKFDFSTEFSKTKRKKQYNMNTKMIEDQQQKVLKYHENIKGVDDTKQKNQYRMRNMESQVFPRKMRSTLTSVSPFLKRCFCTKAFVLRLHKIEHDMNLPSVKISKNLVPNEVKVILPPKKIKMKRKKKSVTNLELLDPYECEPGICDPGKCNPLECLEIIKKRNKSSQKTPAEKKKVSSVVIHTEMPVTKAVQAKVKEKKEKTPKPIIEPVEMKPQYIVEEPRFKGINTLQGVRICSNFSFNVEFYKDSSPSPGTTKADYLEEKSEGSEDNEQTKHTKCSKESVKKMKNQGMGIILGDRTDFDDSTINAKGIGKTKKGTRKQGNFFVRCLCSLKRWSPKKVESISEEPDKKKTKKDNDTPVDKPKKKKTKKGINTVNVAVGPNKRSTQEQFECEPGVCIPGECDPVACLKRIKKRVKEAAVETKHMEKKVAATTTGSELEKKAAATTTGSELPCKDAQCSTTPKQKTKNTQYMNADLSSKATTVKEKQAELQSRGIGAGKKVHKKSVQAGEDPKSVGAGPLATDAIRYGGKKGGGKGRGGKGSGVKGDANVGGTFFDKDEDYVVGTKAGKGGRRDKRGEGESRYDYDRDHRAIELRNLNRKVVRLGSNVNFDVEFFRKRIQKTAVPRPVCIRPAPLPPAPPIIIKPVKVKSQKVYKPLPVKVVSALSIPRVKSAKLQKKTSEKIAPLLKRCFCTLKLQKQLEMEAKQHAKKDAIVDTKKDIILTDSKTNTKAKTKADTTTDTLTDTKAKTNTRTKIKKGPVVETIAESKSKTKRKTKLKSEPVLDTEAETKLKTNRKTKSKLKTEPVVETIAENKSKTKWKSKTKLKNEPKVDTLAEAKSKIKSKVKNEKKDKAKTKFATKIVQFVSVDVNNPQIKFKVKNDKPIVQKGVMPRSVNINRSCKNKTNEMKHYADVRDELFWFTDLINYKSKNTWQRTKQRNMEMETILPYVPNKFDNNVSKTYLSNNRIRFQGAKCMTSSKRNRKGNSSFDRDSQDIDTLKNHLRQSNNKFQNILLFCAQIFKKSFKSKQRATIQHGDTQNCVAQTQCHHRNNIANNMRPFRDLRTDTLKTSKSDRNPMKSQMATMPKKSKSAKISDTSGNRNAMTKYCSHHKKSEDQRKDFNVYQSGDARQNGWKSTVYYLKKPFPRSSNHHIVCARCQIEYNKDHLPPSEFRATTKFRNDQIVQFAMKKKQYCVEDLCQDIKTCKCPKSNNKKPCCTCNKIEKIEEKTKRYKKDLSNTSPDTAEPVLPKKIKLGTIKKVLPDPEPQPKITLPKTENKSKELNISKEKNARKPMKLLKDVFKAPVSPPEAESLDVPDTEQLKSPNNTKRKKARKLDDDNKNIKNKKGSKPVRLLITPSKVIQCKTKKPCACCKKSDPNKPKLASKNLCIDKCETVTKKLKPKKEKEVCDYKPLFLIKMDPGNMKILNKDELFRKVISMKDEKEAQITKDFIEFQQSTDPCTCCICQSRRRGIFHNVVKEPSFLPKAPMAILGAFGDLKSKLSKINLRQFGINIGPKDPAPCTCSKPCQRDVALKRKEEEYRKQLAEIKPCVCGSDICGTEFEKMKLRKVALPKELDPVKFKMRKKKIDKLRLKELRERAEKDAREKKYLAERAKQLAKNKKISYKEQLKREKLKAKDVKKRLKSSSNASLLTDSLLDFGRLGFGALTSLAKGVGKAVINPKGTMQDLRASASDPSGLKVSMKSAVSTGLGPTLSRIRDRLAATSLANSLVSRIEENALTNFVFHMFDSKKRYKTKKRKKVRRREQTNFGCNVFMSTLRRRPCLWVFYKCEWFYPHCLTIVTIFRQITDIIMFLLAVLVWSPCILFMEICRACMCCALCSA